MNNAELINALKDAEGYMIYVAPSCIASSEAIEAIRAAADALEAAEKRIAIVEEERDLERFAAKNYLDKIDELKAQMPKEGEWIEVHDWLHIPQEERGTYRCSACGQVMKYPWNYCPNCGAKMKGANDEQD